MQFVLVVLRMTHIVAGTFWAGSALMIAAVLLPGVSKAGPGAARALPMSSISKAMSVASLLTVLAGSALYVLIYRFEPNWIMSATGLAFTLGSLAGLAAFLLGLLHTGPTARKVAVLGGQMQAAGGPPSAEQQAEMQRLQAGMKSSSISSTILTTVSLVLMSVARYL